MRHVHGRRGHVEQLLPQLVAAFDGGIIFLGFALGVAIEQEPGSLLAALRSGEPGVVALVRDDRVVLDVRCVAQVSELAEAVAKASERAAAQKGARLEGVGTADPGAQHSRGHDDPLVTEV